MTDEAPAAETWPPPNPLLTEQGPPMQPLTFDWALFTTDTGFPFIVLTIHTLLGSLHFAVPGSYVQQSLRPMMEEMFAVLGEPRPIVPKPKIVVPGHSN